MQNGPKLPIIGPCLVLHVSIISCLSFRSEEWFDLSASDTLTNFYVLLVGKPSNIALAKYQPTSKKKWMITGAGSMIGFLERLVIGACLWQNFISIGLVSTAKSIARYNKISEDPAYGVLLDRPLFSILASLLLAAWLCL